MVLDCGVLAATLTYISLWNGFIAGVRDLFLISKDIAFAEVLHLAQWPNLRIINLIFLFVFTKLFTIGYLSH